MTLSLLRELRALRGETSFFIKYKEIKPKTFISLSSAALVKYRPINSYINHDDQNCQNEL